MSLRADAPRSDADLVADLKAGSEDAFEEILRRYEAKVYGLVRSLTGDEGDAQDALQETFLSVYRNIRRFRERSALSTWIYRIATNAALMRLRRRRRDERIVSIEDYLPKFESTGRLSAESAAWPTRGDELLRRKEIATQIREAIAALAPAYRSVFVLRDQEGLGTEDVSSVLGISVPTVKSRLHRARLFLRERLKEIWGGRREAPGAVAPARRRR
ncbi:MAG TPA: sigma-70 family RNA polymerase sigma factor [Candidatus Polarisedimenticolia bacterium]|nr:sigma-70 family RNA polymerase sigma factor [Candidatus Polarisedimenticolia bacterium]